jgi:hypothetical protein
VLGARRWSQDAVGDVFVIVVIVDVIVYRVRLDLMESGWLALLGSGCGSDIAKDIRVMVDVAGLDRRGQLGGHDAELGKAACLLDLC